MSGPTITTDPLACLARMYASGQRLPFQIYVDGKNVATVKFLETLGIGQSAQADPETVGLLFNDGAPRPVRVVAAELIKRCLATGQIADPTPIEPQPIRGRTPKDILVQVARRYRQEIPIPELCELAGVPTAIRDALMTLQHDRSECDPNIAMDVGIDFTPASVCEVAGSLAGRFQRPLP